MTVVGLATGYSLLAGSDRRLPKEQGNRLIWEGMPDDSFDSEDVIP